MKGKLCWAMARVHDFSIKLSLFMCSLHSNCFAQACPPNVLHFLVLTKFQRSTCKNDDQELVQVSIRKYQNTVHTVTMATNGTGITQSLS